MLTKRIWSDLKKVAEANLDVRWFQLQEIDDTFGQDNYPQVVLEVDFNKNPFKTGREMSFAFEVADRITSEPIANRDLAIIDCLSKTEVIAENIIFAIQNSMSNKEYRDSGLTYNFLGMIDFIDKDADKRTGWRVEMNLSTLKPYPNFCKPFYPSHPPTCSVLIAGASLTLNVAELTVEVGFSSIVGLSRIDLYKRNSISAFSLIGTINVPLNNTLTDFQFLVNMLNDPSDNYFFKIDAFSTCEPNSPSSTIEVDLQYTEIPKSFDVVSMTFAPDGSGNLPIQIYIANESRVSDYQVLYRTNQNPMTPFYPVGSFNYDSNAGGIYNIQLNAAFNTNGPLYFVVIGRFTDNNAQQDDNGDNIPEASGNPNPTFFQFDNSLPIEQLLYPINAPQRLSIEEWALLTPPVSGYTYKIEFAGSYGNSKFVDQSGNLNPMLFIEADNWYNPRVIWDYAGINTQIVDVYLQMTIYGPTGQTVCGLVNADFTNIVVISPTVWLRGAINTGITLNSTGVLENVYGPDSNEYFTPNGVNNGLPNPYGNIKMASGFHTYLNAFLVDVIKIELREENEDQTGPKEAVVDSAFMWCLAPDSYSDAVTRKCVDFLTAKSSFIAFNVDPEVDYYVVIKHRNHLTISSKKLRLDKMGQATNMDFRTDVLLNTGGYEVYTDGLGFQFMQYGNAHDESGDVGEVNATDDFLVSQDAGLYVEYSRTDLNLDGNVDSTDAAIVAEGFAVLYYSGVPNAGL